MHIYKNKKENSKILLHTCNKINIIMFFLPQKYNKGRSLSNMSHKKSNKICCLSKNCEIVRNSLKGAFSIDIFIDKFLNSKHTRTL